ncbi:MAG: apolipoprotein N-acyltransferase [Rhodoferax sp.]|nr:MAG: apolipoprotein N-acyltransferase [Rhodoferax sp.]
MVQTASLAWPWEAFFLRGQSLWWLQATSLVAYVIAIEKTQSTKQAGSVGLAFHASMLSTSLYWLYIAMETYGGMPWLLAGAAVLVLAMALSLYGAAAAMLYAHLRRVGGAWRSLLFAATWLLAELARGQWVTGFGWGAAGYAHNEGPLAGLAPWLGVYGIGFVSALWAAVVAHSLLRKCWGQSATAVGMLAAVWWFVTPGTFTQPGAPLTVTLLQGNIAQDEKFESTTGVAMALSWYGEQLHAAQSDLVLAPETAIPLLPQQLPDGYWESVNAPAAAQRTVKLVGIPLGSYSEGYTNSVIALEGLPERLDYRYDKHHLVPFGEFIPPLFKWFVRLMNIPLGDFNRGALQQSSLPVHGARVSPSICFEDLFPEELAVRFLTEASSPTIFANFSNLAWFGDTTAMYQHLHISQMRSLEFERPVLRVSNSGVTAVLDPQGRTTAVLEPLTRGVLHATVQGREGLTPFARWCARWGLWPLWMLGLVLVFTSYLLRVRKSANAAEAAQT